LTLDIKIAKKDLIIDENLKNGEINMIVDEEDIQTQRKPIESSNTVSGCASGIVKPKLDKISNKSMAQKSLYEDI
jgi:hypothetical protein